MSCPFKKHYLNLEGLARSSEARAPAPCPPMFVSHKRHLRRFQTKLVAQCEWNRVECVYANSVAGFLFVEYEAIWKVTWSNSNVSMEALSFFKATFPRCPGYSAWRSRLCLFVETVLIARFSAVSPHHLYCGGMCCQILRFFLPNVMGAKPHHFKKVLCLNSECVWTTPDQSWSLSAWILWVTISFCC